MTIRYSKTRIVAIVLMTLLGITMFAAIANASTNTATIQVTVTDAAKAVLTKDLSAGIAVVDPTGVTLVKGPSYSLANSSNVYTISGLTAKGNYSVSLGDGTTTETINVAGVTPSSSTPTKKVTMIWATGAETKSGKIVSGSIGGFINDSGITSGTNLTTSAAIKVKIVASAATPTWTTSTTTGAFQVYLPVGSYSLIVYGKNSTYRNDTYTLTVSAGQKASPFDTMSDENPWPITALGISKPTDATFGKDVTINFADSLKKMTSISTSVFITTGSAITAADVVSNSLYTLTPATASKAGKIVIKAAAFNDVGPYLIKLSNGAYDDTQATVTQNIIPSTTTKAPALTFTQAAATPTTNYGAITLTVTPGPNHSISYVLSDKTITTPYIGVSSNTLTIPQTATNATTTFSALTLPNGTGTISGLDLVNRKYLGVYELTANKAIAKFKQITLTKTMINTDSTVPTAPIISATVGSSTVTMTFAENVYMVGTNTACKSAIKLKANSSVTTSSAISSVDVSGTTVTITLASPFATGNVITMKANTIQSAYAFKNSAISGTSTTSSALATTFPGSYFAWAPGTTNGTTVATSVPAGTLKYYVGTTGAEKTQPNVGTSDSDYSNVLTANTIISQVTSGNHIFVVQLDSNGKIVQWKNIPVTNDMYMHP